MSAARHRIKPRTWTPERIALMTEIKATNPTWRQLGAALGVSDRSAEEAWIRYGGQTNNAKPATRLCLCGCGQRFGSSHAGERIRPECRHVWEQRV